jgi:hypothetical protein
MASSRPNDQMQSAVLLSQASFVVPGRLLHQFLVLDQLKAGNRATRAISRAIGVSAGLVSQYTAEFRRSRLVTADGRLTALGRGRHEADLRRLRQELLQLSDALDAEFRPENLHVAAIPCTSSFLAARMAPIRERRAVIVFESTAEQALRLHPDAHFYIVGNVPALRLINIGFNLSIELNLLPEAHWVVGRGPTTTLIVVGEDSVSASLVATARAHGESFLHAYRSIRYAHSVGEALQRAESGEGDVLLWQPFAKLLRQKEGQHRKFEFPSTRYSTHVLVRNRDQFVEETVEKSFIGQLREMVRATPPDSTVIRAARAYLSSAKS